jgi:hypothetical protein
MPELIEVMRLFLCPAIRTRRAKEPNLIYAGRGLTPQLYQDHRTFLSRNTKLADQNFRRSRRREFDADAYYPQHRAFGARPRFNRALVEASSGPSVGGVAKWFSPEKGFRFVELSDGSGDAFLHGSD